MHSKNIVAIGGGGFGRSLGSLEIEKYIISLISKKRPKICFIPTASGDSSLYKLNFYRAFSRKLRRESFNSRYHLCWRRKYKKYVGSLERMEFT